ncbi:MAG: hypothetical protein ACREOK_00510 [Gemmatimonadaceae bacterium]
MPESTMESHGTDAAFVRLIDSQAVAGDEALAAHTRQCEPCAIRLRELADRSRAFSTLLAKHPLPAMAPERLRHIRGSVARNGSRAPSPFWSRSDVRIAAGVLLFATLVVASPAAAWIAEQLGRLGAGSAPADVVGSTNSGNATGDSVGAPGTSISFAPESPTLNVRLAGRQRSGALILFAGGTERVSAEIVPGIDPGRESLLVLPNELRIANSDMSGASYHLTLPPTVRTVIVAIGNTTVRVAVTPGMRREIRLAAP